ncbi:MAG: glycosyltransferase, partial [Spirochaetes bacterium]|nr:glycosyltransferase [Spirochaetota bacterium]
MEKCLLSFINQDFPIDKIEIIVVDGASLDDTLNILKKLQQKYSQIKVLNNPAQKTPHALNIGIQEAAGEYIIIFGAHSFADKNFLKNNLAALKLTNAECVGGVIDTIGQDNRSEAIALAMTSPFGVGNALFRYTDKACYADTVAFGAYQRSVFDKIGLFDEELVRNNDAEFNFRLILAKGKI